MLERVNALRERIEERKDRARRAEIALENALAQLHALNCSDVREAQKRIQTLDEKIKMYEDLLDTELSELEAVLDADS